MESFPSLVTGGGSRANDMSIVGGDSDSGTGGALPLAITSMISSETMTVATTTAIDVVMAKPIWLKGGLGGNARRNGQCRG